MSYKQTKHDVGVFPASPKHPRMHLLHGTREALAPPIPEPRGSYNHKLNASY